MHDPFPIPPPALLVKAATPLCEYLNLPTLPIHIHELLLAAMTYHTICAYISPFLSRRLFPSTYPVLPRRSQLNWDVHVVSLVQSVVVCAAAIWVMVVDKERKGMSWEERIWGYTGAGGMIQAFAAGYFLWDLQICIRYLGVFGWGLLLHAVAALIVFSLGFRPFVNYYGPTFILYELSSPFLNFHWFFDKLQMTGSRPQWYNGILLLGSFFCCRLLWGTYQSLRVYQDCWAALHFSETNTLKADGLNAPSEIIHPKGILELMDPTGGRGELMKYNPYPENMPLWLGLTYLGSNMLLNTLNFYWFGKMIETVKKRFRTPREDRKAKEDREVVDAVVEGVELDGRAVEEAMDGQVEGEKGMNGEAKPGEASGLEQTNGEVRRRKS
ncbi:MAG: hypothetical protein Q9166_001576 [cf. Caloplaca sp. 2 TL-2023]